MKTSHLIVENANQAGPNVSVLRPSFCVPFFVSQPLDASLDHPEGSVRSDRDTDGWVSFFTHLTPAWITLKAQFALTETLEVGVTRPRFPFGLKFYI